MSRRCLAYGTLLLALAVAPGCGSGDSLNRQAVSGTVTLDGQPLDQGTIEFVPTDAQGLLSGSLITSGNFAVPADKGLPPGKYTVRISSAEATGGPAAPSGADLDNSQPAKERIPAKYNSESELTAEVTDGGANTFTFDLKSS